MVRLNRAAVAVTSVVIVTFLYRILAFYDVATPSPLPAITLQQAPDLFPSPSSSLPSSASSPSPPITPEVPPPLPQHPTPSAPPPAPDPDPEPEQRTSSSQYPYQHLSDEAIVAASDPSNTSPLPASVVGGSDFSNWNHGCNEDSNNGVPFPGSGGDYRLNPGPWKERFDNRVIICDGW
jgi:hypothetical protein